MDVKSSSSNKEEGEAAAGQEKESCAKKQINVTMGMEPLDCPVCSNPLRPPIFQCSLGHFVCSPCRGKLPDSKCHVCSGAVLESSCRGMERVVDSVLVPCPYAEHGCTERIAYYLRREHQEACPHAPCFCPDPGCGFAGCTAALLDHFTARHEWPATAFKYYAPFDLAAKPGLHVLRAQDERLFLLNVALPEFPLHAVSIVCVRRPKKASEESSGYGCSVGFSSCKGRYHLTSLDAITSSSLSDGLPKECFCFVPKASDGAADVVLTITIDTELMDDDEEEEEQELVEEEEDDDDDEEQELEEEDDDDNYEEEED